MALINTYQTHLYGGSGHGQLGWRAVILLKDASNQIVGRIYFTDSAPESGSVSNGIILLYYSSEMLANVLDLLRNEKPMYIYYDITGAYLSTSNEPTGDGEG